MLHLAAVFAILTRQTKPEREGLDLPKKLRLFAGEAVEGFSETEAARLRAESPDEGLTGRQPALRHQCPFRPPSPAATRTA